MSRLALVSPFFIAIALSAQTPAQPPTPPVRPLRPVPPSYFTPEPMVFTVPDLAFRFDNNFVNSYSALTDYAWSKNLDFANSDLMANTMAWTESGFGGGPVRWARQDPADSLYGMARERLNRGDYRKAAELFKSLPQKYPGSVYIPDAQYWQAFALYRIGGTPELQEALAVLEARKPDAPDDSRRAPRANVSINGDHPFVVYTRGRTDAAGLAARIASVLSSRGMAGDAAVKRALAAAGNVCDQEDQSVRAEALNALMQNDPETGRQMAAKILANRDECSVPLRRNAVMLVGYKHDDAAASTLIPVAKSDPSPSVRIAAMEYLVRVESDAAVNAVIDLARSADDQQVQRAAVSALAASTNPRARSEVRTLIENNAGNESLRISALDGLDRDRLTGEDAAWLRGLYAKTTSTRIKERIISAASRAGGEANNQWLTALVQNEDEPLDSRTTALAHMGRKMDVAALGRMYDASPQRPIRQTVIELLSERKEPGALDKLVEIARNGTDPAMRRQAISVLARSKDPRASQLLLQLVDKQ